MSNVDKPETDTILLLKTTDGGNSWQKMETGLGEKEFNHVKFLDKNNGWLLGKTTIYKTEDGGNSWKSVFRIEETE